MSKYVSLIVRYAGYVLEFEILVVIEALALTGLSQFAFWLRPVWYEWATWFVGADRLEPYLFGWTIFVLMHFVICALVVLFLGSAVWQWRSKS